MKPTGVLITGGGGFIGSHLAEYYLDKNIPVVCVDNFCTGLRQNKEELKEFARLENIKDKSIQSTPENASEKLLFFEKDVSLPWDWAKIIGPDVLKKISHVFHLASPASPPLYQEMAFETLWVNSVGLKHALEFSDSIGARLIFSSTSEVYGDPDCSPQPESYWGRVNSFGERSCYDESKRFGEALIFTHNQKKKTQHGLVRIFNTYGPRMNPNDGRVVINFMVQAQKNEPLTIYGNGEQTRSFCYISDLIDGLARYAETQMTTPVNLGNDIEFKINDLVKEIKNLYPNKAITIKNLPLPKDDPRQRRPDLTLAKKQLSPWAPKVSLKEGLLNLKSWVEK
jgi:nucleoside-diphosphate-sugar epimerase